MRMDYVEVRLADPASLEGRALAAFMSAFEKEGRDFQQQYEFAGSARSLPDVLLQLVNDFGVRLADHVLHIMHGQHKGVDEGKTYRTLLRLVLSRVSARLVRAVAAQCRDDDARLESITRSFPEEGGDDAVARGCGVACSPDQCWDVAAALLGAAEECPEVPLQQLVLLTLAVRAIASELRKRRTPNSALHGQLPHTDDAEDVAPVLAFLLCRRPRPISKPACPRAAPAPPSRSASPSRRSAC